MVIISKLGNKSLAVSNNCYSLAYEEISMASGFKFLTFSGAIIGQPKRVLPHLKGEESIKASTFFRK